MLASNFGFHLARLLLMFPVLVYMYGHLARLEEREVRAEFGKARDDYAATTPAFVPRVHGQPFRAEHAAPRKA